MKKWQFTLVILLLALFFQLSFVFAGTILSPYKYAWSDNVGYINFKNVIVDDSVIGGYAWSANNGWIKFNPAQGGVSNDGNGNLSGYAWGEGLGWINFDTVSIDTTTGKFSGTATGALIGTLTFDCPNYCDVRTDWRPAPPSSPSSPSSGGGGGGGSPSTSSGSPSGGGIIPTPFPVLTITPPLPSRVETQNQDLAIAPDRSGTPQGATAPITEAATPTREEGTPALFDVALSVGSRETNALLNVMPISLGFLGVGIIYILWRVGRWKFSQYA